ncbi:MAG: DUF2809 domain-containing protein [Bryobacterales bacterium]|nr:DUF2809 domain-containing protein [Bryobacterales bacterium]
MPKAAAILLTVLAGYILRFHAPIPATLRDASGGIAYVLAFALLASYLLPPTLSALAALTFTCTVEFLQLWHPPFLEAARQTLPGRLVLGTTFHWSDFPPYVAGTLLARRLLKRR